MFKDKKKQSFIIILVGIIITLIIILFNVNTGTKSNLQEVNYLSYSLDSNEVEGKISTEEMVNGSKDLKLEEGEKNENNTIQEKKGEIKSFHTQRVLNRVSLRECNKDNLFKISTLLVDRYIDIIEWKPAQDYGYFKSKYIPLVQNNPECITEIRAYEKAMLTISEYRMEYILGMINKEFRPRQSVLRSLLVEIFEENPDVFITSYLVKYSEESMIKLQILLIAGYESDKGILNH